MFGFRKKLSEIESPVEKTTKSLDHIKNDTKRPVEVGDFIYENATYGHCFPKLVVKIKGDELLVRSFYVNNSISKPGVNNMVVNIDKLEKLKLYPESMVRVNFSQSVYNKMMALNDFVNNNDITLPSGGLYYDSVFNEEGKLLTDVESEKKAKYEQEVKEFLSYATGKFQLMISYRNENDKVGSVVVDKETAESWLKDISAAWQKGAKNLQVIQKNNKLSSYISLENVFEISLEKAEDMLVGQYFIIDTKEKTKSKTKRRKN